MLAAKPAPVAPTPQGLEEEAAKAALEPTEVQRKTGNRPNGHIKVGDLDVTIETVMGAEKNSRFIFSYARKNEA